MVKKIIKIVLKYPIKFINSIYTYFYYKNSPKNDDVQINNMLSEDERILVLSPHVDDETIGLGATLLKHKDLGNSMGLVYLTDGGGSTSNLSREKLVEERKKEGERIKKAYGFHSLYFLEKLDGRLNSDDEELVKKVVEILDIEKPTLIYTPFLIDGHKDHVETTRVLMRALQIWDRDFNNIYMYEVNCPISPSLVNSISIIDEDLYNRKGDIYNIFTSQWAMGFDAFRLLDRRKKFIANAGYGAYGAEVFIKTNLSNLLEMEKILEKEGFKPEHFRQLSSEYNLILSFNINRKLKEEYNKKIDTILKK